MTLARNHLVLAAGAIALGTFLGALFLQHGLGWIPCEMCFWHRYPHAIIAALAAVCLVLPGRLLAYLGAAVASVGVGIAIYHSGVERKWWAGPDSCTGGTDLTGLSGTDLLDFSVSDKIVNCDQVSHTILGLTLANWNIAVSLALVVLWLMVARRS